MDDKTYTLERMTAFVKQRLNEITKVNLYDIGLSEEELKIIEKRASLTNEKSLSSYLRKQAIKGFIINVNFSEFDHLRKNITAIGTNINQIAKRVNSTNRFYDEDIEYIKKVQKEIWQSLNSVQSKLRSL